MAHAFSWIFVCVLSISRMRLFRLGASFSWPPFNNRWPPYVFEWPVFLFVIGFRRTIVSCTTKSYCVCFLHFSISSYGPASFPLTWPGSPISNPLTSQSWISIRMGFYAMTVYSICRENYKLPELNWLSKIVCPSDTPFSITFLGSIDRPAISHKFSQFSFVRFLYDVLHSQSNRKRRFWHAVSTFSSHESCCTDCYLFPISAHDIAPAMRLIICASLSMYWCVVNGFRRLVRAFSWHFDGDAPIQRRAHFDWARSPSHMSIFPYTIFLTMHIA